TSTGTGGTGGSVDDLDQILAELRADTDAAMAKYAGLAGWPVPVKGGRLFVNLDGTLPLLAGDHDNWQGTPLTSDKGFSWLVVGVMAGDHYKFTDKTTWTADPWARSYTYDNNGEISLVAPSIAHLDRWPRIGDTNLEPRTVRVWVPAEPIKHELYL